MLRDRTYFLLRRLHSLTGIIPAGVFLLAHLFINSGALLGECQFTDGVRTINSLPFLPYIEIFGILGPLAFHGALGLWMLVVQSKFNVGTYSYARNWWYVLQRITGFLVAAFLLWHLYDTWLAKQMGQLSLEEFYGHLGQGMSRGYFVVAMYTVGTIAASFHLANGLWGFLSSWGILQSRRAQRIGGWVFGLAGLALVIVWSNIIVHFASGGHNWLPVQEPPVPCGAEELRALDD